MLVLSRKPGESLLIGDNVEIFISEVSGDKVKIGITAPSDMKIIRSELLKTVEENKTASHKVERSALRAFIKSNNESK